MLACHCTPQTEDKCEGEHRGEHVTRNKVVDAVWRERESREQVAETKAAP